MVFIEKTCILVALGNEHVGSHARILNRSFAARRIILGDGKNQSRVVGHLDQLRDGTIAKSLVANYVAAGVFKDGSRDDFRGSCRSMIDQDRDGKIRNVFAGIGIERLAREFLSLQVGDCAVIEKEIGCGYAFILVASRAIAQIENKLLRALLLQIAHLAGDFLRHAGRERRPL